MYFTDTPSLNSIEALSLWLTERQQVLQSRQICQGGLRLPSLTLLSQKVSAGEETAASCRIGLRRSDDDRDRRSDNGAGDQPCGTEIKKHKSLCAQDKEVLICRILKLCQTKLPHRAKLVYLYLYDRMDKRKSMAGIKTIAADLHLSRSTVKRAVKDLEKASLIRKEPHYRENGSAASNPYDLILKLYFYIKGDVCLFEFSQSRNDFVGRRASSRENKSRDI